MNEFKIQVEDGVIKMEGIGIHIVDENRIEVWNGLCGFRLNLDEATAFSMVLQDTIKKLERYEEHQQKLRYLQNDDKEVQS